MACHIACRPEGLSMDGGASSSRRRGVGVLVAILIVVAAVLSYIGFVPTAAQNVVMSAPYVQGDVPLDPASDAWAAAPMLSVPLSGQIFVVPHGGGTITGLAARALVNDTAVSVLVEWRDGTRDVSIIRTEDFADSVAVQIIDASGGTPPFVCMGQTGFQTQIWQWRADRDPYAGGGLRLEDVYPNIYADWYPFENESDFYPSLYVGNVLMRQNETPVQVLVAGGAGTLAPADTVTVFGAGTWPSGSWRVVLSRKLAPAALSEVPLRLGQKFAISFAVWNGSAGERDGQKATSSWIDLYLYPSSSITDRPLIVAIIGVFLLAIIVVVLRQKPREPSPTTRANVKAPEGTNEAHRRTRREFLGLLGPAATGLGVAAAAAKIPGLAVLNPPAQDDANPLEWEDRRERMMGEFEEGYRKPRHLR